MTPSSRTSPRIPNARRYRRTNLLATARNLLIQARSEGVHISNETLLPLQHEVERALLAERVARNRENWNGESQANGTRLGELPGEEAAVDGDSDVDMTMDINNSEEGEVFEWGPTQASDVELEEDSPAIGIGFFDTGGTYWVITGASELERISLGSLPSGDGNDVRAEGEGPTVSFDDLIEAAARTIPTRTENREVNGEAETAGAGDSSERPLTDTELEELSTTTSQAPPATLQREDALISDTGAKTGESTVDGSPTKNAESEPQPTKEQQLEEIRVRREHLMRQMNADITHYALERERAFGREHGYRVHSPESSLEREPTSPTESDDSGNGEVSSNDVSPRSASIPINGRRISRPSPSATSAADSARGRNPTRRLINANGRRFPQPSQRATVVTDSAIVLDPMEDFTHVLITASPMRHLVRTATGGIPNSRGARIHYSLATSSSDAANEQDQARFRQAAGLLNPPFSTMILAAEADGMDVREGIEFLRRWESFSTNWRPSAAEISDIARLLITMFWTALRWGWGDNFWTPSVGMRSRIADILQQNVYQTTSVGPETSQTNTEMIE